jgi:indolepyruvate ferredoxin oxidoreductase beta subunit
VSELQGRPKPDSPQPFAVLIAALGGEGGGVLADWLVQCALRSGLAVQATSVPGVAQRTGATSYYLEWMTRALPAGSGAPVFSLNPLPGRVDALIASEAVEAARMIERGFVSPDRTLLIASTHRVYTTAEKMHMADGRFDTVRTQDVARQLARRVVLLDMEAAAARHGTILSAVMFGALSGAGVLPCSREVCEAVLGEGGRGGAASLAGFDDAWRQAADAAVQVHAAEAAGAPAVGADALRVLQMANLSESLLRGWSRAIGALPQPMQASAAHGGLRCRDYQDDEYAGVFFDGLARLAAAASAAEGGVAAGSLLADTLDEATRQLALWMCFEDVIRVADLKSRRTRYQRVRVEAQAGGAELVRVVEYLKPGIDEIAAIMPRRFGGWLMHKARDGSWFTRLQTGLHIPSTSLWGYLLLRGLARLRPWRRSSLRFAEEQAAIAGWMQALVESLPVSPRFAAELAALPQVLKGYGDTQLRGRHNYSRLWASHVAPAFSQSADDKAGLDAAALRLKEALAATLADPEGNLNKAAATAASRSPEGAPTPGTPTLQPIRWLERTARNA